LIKRFFAIGLLFLFFSSFPILPGGGVAAAEEMGFINLNQARDAHPLGGELEFLEKKYSNYQKTLSNLYQQQSFFAQLIAKHDRQVEKKIEEAREKIEQEFEEELQQINQRLTDKYGTAELEIEEQARKNIAEFERKLQGKYQEKIAEELGRFNQEYREFREEIRDEYSFEIFNLRLQLQMAQLTEEERKEKEGQLEVLENKRDETLRQKEMEIFWAMRTISLSLQLELEQEFSSYIADQEAEVQRQEENFRAEKEEEKSILVDELEKEKEVKIENREKEIREKFRENIARSSQKLNEELIEQVERIHSKMSNLEGEIAVLKTSINNDLVDIAEKISREKGLKVEMVETMDYEAGIDLTNRVIEMLE